METMNADVINEIGRQIEPNCEGMSRLERETFERLVSSLADKELKAKKLATYRTELECLAKMIEHCSDDVNQELLFKRYRKLTEDIDNA